MPRSTKRNVKTTQISTNEIREVFNSDSSSRPIPEKSRKASDFFVDGSVENSIYNNFIDEDYCPADEGETKKDKFTRHPFKWSYWKNYGGNEFGEEYLPEIYWANVMTDSDLEHIPQTDEALLEMSGTNEDSQTYIPRITINTPIENSFGAISSSIAKAQGLPNEDMSYLHRPDEGDITEAKLGTKVGIDYISSSYLGVPEFEVKITPLLAKESLNYWIEDKQFLAFDTLKGISTGDITTIASLTEFALETLTTYSSELESYINFLSSKGYSGDDLEAMLGLIGNAKIKKIDFLTESVKDTASSLDGFSIALLMLNVANLIWDKAHPPARITQMSYQYQQTIEGMYNFLDIKDCTYKINPDNFQQYGSSVELDLPEEGASTYYSLNSPNFGDPLSPSNLITRFPNRNVTRDKFLNLWFFTRAIQYDVCTPPPVVEYLVELLPTAYCKLSETKVTKFIVRVLPDKYLQPFFSIETEVNESPFRPIGETTLIDILNPIPTIYNNTSILFKNGKYADLILLKALDKSGGILGYFDTYVNAVVGSCYNASKNGSYYGDVIGKDVLLSLPSIVPPDTPPYPNGFVGDTSIYETYFQAESVRNVILNPYFRVEKSDIFGEELTKYWTYTSGLEIQKGSIVKSTTGTATLEQNLPSGLYVGSIDYPSYYLLNIEFNNSAGYLYLDTSDTLFDTNIYDKHNKLVTPFLGIGKPYRKTVIPESEWGTPEDFEIKVTLEDYNVSIESSSIKFLSSGTHSILLKALPDSAKKIKFIFSSDFIGSMSKCTLIRMPNSSAGAGGRGNYSLQSFAPVFQYVNDVIKSKTFYLFFTGSGSFDMEVQAFTSALISVYTYNNTKYGNFVQLAPGIHTIPVPGIGQNVRVEVEITNFNETSDFSYEYPCNILSLVCNSRSLYGIVDDLGVLTDAYIDFSGTSLKDESFYNSFYKKFFNQTMVEYYKNNPSLVASFHFAALQALFLAKQKLNNPESTVLANLPISMNTLLINDSSLERYLYTLRGVINSKIDLSNTSIEGSLISLLYIPEVVAVNTKISKLGTGPTTYKLDVEPKLTWKNSNIAVEELNNLLLRLDNSETLNGTLDIAGNNPEITNTYALEAIDSLVSKGWNVLYNAKTIPVITLVGDNPLTWTLGETFVDPGATAYDERDGDITESIVVTDNIDVNTEGTYQVTYNVTDSDGNAAEEVVRTVVVEEIKTIWGTEIVEVTNPVTGRTWMDRNIGATRAATSSTDSEAYGHLFQWGRNPDGHELRTSGTTSVLSTTDVPGHGNFITPSSSPYDWRSPQNDNLWQGIIADGWRLPTEQEWNEERLSWSSNDAAGAYGSVLKLPVAGFRYNSNGSLYNVGSYGHYWSSTVGGTLASSLYFYSSNASMNSSYRADGFSVRLIKDYPHIPTITLLGDSSVTINVGDTYTDAGATATDTRYGDITSDIVVVNNVNTSVAGTYTVTYNITTEDGYTAEEVVRVVNVEEAIEWTYEGVITVGEFVVEGVGRFLGWISNGIGAIAPDLAEYGSGIIGLIDLGLENEFHLGVDFVKNDDNMVFTTDDIILYIDGVEYVLPWFGEGGSDHSTGITTNPFSEVGSTHNIKLQYKLAQQL